MNREADSELLAVAASYSRLNIKHLNITSLNQGRVELKQILQGVFFSNTLIQHFVFGNI